jgi:histidinol dehydrogenase
MSQAHERAARHNHAAAIRNDGDDATALQMDGVRHTDRGDRATFGAGTFRFTGAVEDLAAVELRALFERGTSWDDATRTATAAILGRVRQDGDAALVAMARDFDGVALAALEVPMARCREALDALDPALRRAMERAAANIETAHRAFLPEVVEVETEPGVVVGRRPDPLGAVGVYAPGGRAAYPSSVLMGAVPARVAGVATIVLCSPPQRDTGLPNESVLAAAALAGVTRVFALGGAGAIAAMAFGTESVPRVDRVVGPGNAYVAEAKLQVSGAVAIDSPAGPSELLVIADHAADPAAVARELVAQAEHDPQAAVVCVAVGDEVAAQVADAVAELLPGAARGEIVRAALGTAGGLLVAQTYDEAIAFANRYAAEHLQLAVGEPECGAVLERLRNAGTVFLGEQSSVAFGDYMTGANHVLPTGGLARSYSGLSTLDFFRWTTYQRVTRAAAARLSGDVCTFADAERLPGHASAARGWGNGGSDA